MSAIAQAVGGGEVSPESPCQVLDLVVASVLTQLLHPAEKVRGSERPVWDVPFLSSFCKRTENDLKTKLYWVVFKNPNCPFKVPQKHPPSPAWALVSSAPETQRNNPGRFWISASFLKVLKSKSSYTNVTEQLCSYAKSITAC